uniref:Tyrosine-protein phosphatase non-receptor type 9 n=1 Tax=Strigamia maritima TaxID=126957 RepID=T1IWR5_STRMM
MYDSLTSRQKQATKEFIETVNGLRRERNAGPIPWNTALKFLMARKFDVRRAVSLYEQHETTRIREGLVHFDPSCEHLREELETGKFTILPARDASGAAIAIFTACKHQPLLTSHQITLQGVVYQLDVALESIETQRCGLVFIYDMTNSKYNNFDYDLSQKILTLLKGGYPARLKKVLIVTAPLWFKAPFKILRLFVREKLRDRVFTVNTPQLSLHIPSSSLPLHLGGALEVEHKAWLLYCYKSMANRHGDLCDLQSPTPLKNSESEESNSQGIVEKHNDEDREKEVEVTKLNSLLLASNGDDENAESEGSITFSPNHVSTASEPSPASSDMYVDAADKPLPSSPRMRRPSASSGSSHDDSLHFDDGRGTSIAEFIDHVRSRGQKGLYKDYQDIKSRSPEGSFEASKLKSNLSKNRYTDVLCFDHSRVRLSQIEGDVQTDYVNANFVDGYKQRNAFITTQGEDSNNECEIDVLIRAVGPLPKTSGDFWRMIWEQHVLVIVMTTRVVERGRIKCGQYWPAEEEGVEKFSPFVVTNNRVEQHKDYIYTSLTISDTRTSETREVTHLQFTSWPDYGVPHSALAMLDFLVKVREYQSKAVSAMGMRWGFHPSGPPIVVHCSAGIGRTGTFITLDISIRRLEDVGTIDVQATVERIRSQRAYSIQMPDQYVFCHLALIEYILREGLIDDVDLSGFADSDTDSDE